MADVGDYGYVVDTLLGYLKGKGQIHSAANMASIKLLDKLFQDRFGIELGLSRFVDAWVLLSEIEPSKFKTVAQANVEAVTRISTTVNYVEQHSARTRYLPFGRKKEHIK